jgi:hypothetical protein
MSFGVNVYQAHSINSFEAAEQYFNRTPQPRGKHWVGGDTRPLASNRQPHMALEQVSYDQYACTLYGKRVVCYHRPKDGTRTEEFFGTHHQATWAWLWRHASKGRRNMMRDTDGRDILVPVGSGMRTIITTRAHSPEVIMELSSHPQIYTTTSNEADKAKRAKLKGKVANAVELAMHTLVWQEKEWVTSANGRKYLKSGEAKQAFDSMLPSISRHSETPLQRALTKAMQSVKAELDEPVTEDEIGPIIEAANVAYNYCEEQPTVEAFRKNYVQYLVRKAGLNTQSGRKLYPMFPDYDSVPRGFGLIKG